MAPRTGRSQKNDQKETREPAEEAAAADVQQTGLNESRRQK